MKLRLRTSIRLKLTIATLVPLVTAIAILWVIGFSIIVTRFYIQAQQTVETDLNSAREIFRGELARLSDIIRLTGLSPELLSSLLDGGDASTALSLQAMLRNDRLSFLTLVDHYGFVRYRAGNPGSAGDMLKTEQMIKDALSGTVSSGITLMSSEQAGLENPQLPPLMKIPIKPTPHAHVYTKQVENRGMFLVAAAPVIAIDGSVAGAVYGGVLLNGNNRLIDRITNVIFKPRGDSGRPSGNATLFLDDLRIATTVLDEREERAIGSMMSSEVYNDVRRGEKWNGRAYVLNEPSFTAYEPLRDYRGMVVGALYVGMPERPYLELRSQINLVFSGVLVFVTLIGVILSAWLGASLSRPIKAVEDGARRIAAGEQLPDIVLGSHDEIAVLAEEFNIMKHRVEEREAENLALNHTLEEKVAERTARVEEQNQLLLVAQQELARAERLVGIGLLASGVAHEINNPLAIIRGYTELLQLEFAAESSSQKDLDVIMRQVVRIERIIKNLRAFSRTGSKRLSSFYLGDLLDDILDQVGHQVLLDPYTVVRGYQGKEIRLEADEDQLQQVFTNLIVNGLQAMEEGGTLTVDISDDPEAGQCRVMVTDSGQGIAEGDRERLFTPFFTTKQKGTGLGLSVSYGIVKDHGGEIEVQSELGQGAVFTVVLPLRQEGDKVSDSRNSATPGSKV